MQYCQSPKQSIKKDTCLQQFQKLLSESLNRKQIHNKENNRTSLRCSSKHPIQSQINQDLKKTLIRVKTILQKAQHDQQILIMEKKELLQQLEQRDLLIEQLYKQLQG